MDCFSASILAHVRPPGESLEAGINRLVMKVFPNYEAVALRKEKILCFLAGLDLTLKAKCLLQGATDLEEALTIVQWC